MSFQFLPFTKLKSNFYELKDLLLTEENAEKIKTVERIISELISSNANDTEKSKTLTGAILNANFVIPKVTPKPVEPVWRIIDLDVDTKPRQVSTPITDVNSAIGVSKDNVLDDESRHLALTACLEHMSKSLVEFKKENEQRRSAFANKFKLFGGIGDAGTEKKNTPATPGLRK